MHYETFPLTALSHGEAQIELEKQRGAMAIGKERFIAGEVGKSWRFTPPQVCEN